MYEIEIWYINVSEKKNIYGVLFFIFLSLKKSILSTLTSVTFYLLDVVSIIILIIYTIVLS